MPGRDAHDEEDREPTTTYGPHAGSDATTESDAGLTGGTGATVGESSLSPSPGMSGEEETESVDDQGTVAAGPRKPPRASSKPDGNAG